VHSRINRDSFGCYRSLIDGRTFLIFITLLGPFSNPRPTVRARPYLIATAALELIVQIQPPTVILLSSPYVTSQATGPAASSSPSFTSLVPDRLYSLRRLLPLLKYHHCTVALLFLMLMLLHTAI
jgi:hypothetical protein